MNILLLFSKADHPRNIYQWIYKIGRKDNTRFDISLPLDEYDYFLIFRSFILIKLPVLFLT
jgi:hypothetical protein